VREEVLRRFFRGETTAAELAKDIAGSTHRLGPIASRVDIEDMDDEFFVTRLMLVSLTDAVLAGSLPPEALGIIGFALEASDKFAWDGDADELVARIIADWSCPEINYPFTFENVASFRAWLTEAESYPSRPEDASRGRGALISTREKKPSNRNRKV
jgi:hypothetical protein